MPVPMKPTPTGPVPAISEFNQGGPPRSSSGVWSVGFGLGTTVRFEHHRDEGGASEHSQSSNRGIAGPDHRAARLRRDDPCPPGWRRGCAPVSAAYAFAGNIRSLAQLRALTDEIYAANPRAVVAVDEEGGEVTRLLSPAPAPPYPGNAVLGRIDDLEVTRAVAEQVGWRACAGSDAT